MKVLACANLIITNPVCHGWLPWNFCEFDLVARVFWMVAEWPKKTYHSMISWIVFLLFFYCPPKWINCINQVKNINQVSGQNHMHFLFIFSTVELEKKKWKENTKFWMYLELFYIRNQNKNKKKTVE